MKVKPFILSSLVGAALYKTYENRLVLKHTLKAKRELVKKSQEDITTIGHNLELVKEQTGNINQISQDLTYKFRVFNTEAQATIQEIKQILSKYQKDSAQDQDPQS
ncbi:hypothetical protein [Streptococcus cuniculipharyngis]|uniref:Uncharacterized protein n=1 Tax=Streptococcus cuniculipharyngis TaxID=1562651 RepID=A0A5C5S8Q2_9STRE|nr:hypothetical protein [Streptococcus cuniculipharyngis]TWS96688.1 hypothetical protein FRX57_06905 [Streptococcus cuniculipharyngis]